MQYCCMSVTLWDKFSGCQNYFHQQCLSWSKHRYKWMCSQKESLLNIQEETCASMLSLTWSSNLNGIPLDPLIHYVHVESERCSKYFPVSPTISSVTFKKSLLVMKYRTEMCICTYNKIQTAISGTWKQYEDRLHLFSTRMVFQKKLVWCCFFLKKETGKSCKKLEVTKRKRAAC